MCVLFICPKSLQKTYLAVRKYLNKKTRYSDGIMDNVSVDLYKSFNVRKHVLVVFAEGMKILIIKYNKYKDHVIITLFN